MARIHYGGRSQTDQCFPDSSSFRGCRFLLLLQLQSLLSLFLLFLLLVLRTPSFAAFTSLSAFLFSASSLTSWCCCCS